jgi:hypothetical protein
MHRNVQVCVSLFNKKPSSGFPPVSRFSLCSMPGLTFRRRLAILLRVGEKDVLSSCLQTAHSLGQGQGQGQGQGPNNIGSTQKEL